MRVPQPTSPPPDGFGGSGGRSLPTRRGARVVGGGDGLGDHLVGFVDRALDAGGDDRLAGEAAPVLDADVGGEDDGVGGGDRRRRPAGCCPRSPASRPEVDAGALGGDFQRVGGHVGVGDAGGAGGDRDDRLRRGYRGFRLGQRSGACHGHGCRGGGRCRRGVDHPVDQGDHLVGRGCVAQRLDEVRPHQRPGQAGQQLHVLGPAGIRCGDQEHEIRRTVGRTEVDRRIQPCEADAGRSRRTATDSAGSRYRRAGRWPTGPRGPWPRPSGRLDRWTCRRRRAGWPAARSPPPCRSRRRRRAGPNPRS